MPLNSRRWPQQVVSWKFPVFLCTSCVAVFSCVLAFSHNSSGKIWANRAVFPTMLHAYFATWWKHEFFFQQHLIHCCMADLVKVKIPSANWYGYHNNLRMFQGKNYNYNLFRETCFRKKIPPATTLLCCIPFNTGLSMQHSPRYYGASLQSLLGNLFQEKNTPCYYAALLHSIQHRSINAT